VAMRNTRGIARAADVTAWLRASAIEACGQTRWLQGAAFGGD
jgi:hypothetical protein